MAFSETLDRLIEDGVIDTVRGLLMSGKEASVYVVERQGELLAAKVYKAREQRTFKATASYTEGRNQTRNTRDRRAMGKRSSYGKELIEESWRDAEVRALSQAYHAGVRVPQPFMLHDDVLLMELLVDEQGTPAPRLADFELPRDEAARLHHDIYGQVRMLLMCGKIHGDLSAFNILMAKGGPTLIDMPQVVDAATNNQARDILRRDLRNVTEHLARFDARLLRFRDCGDALWVHYVNGTLESALAPEEGSVAGGHHRSRRSRDAERGRMGRERPDGAPERRDGQQRGGAALAGTPDRGPPRQGPPRDGPPRDGQPRQGPPRDGPPQNGPPRQGPPRVGQSQNGPPQNGQPRQGPPRDGYPQNGPPRQGPPRDGYPQNGPPRQGPPRDGPPQNGPPRQGPPREGQPGPPRQGPPRDGPPRFDQRGPLPPRDGTPGGGPRRS